jgi:hypothetical protein
MSVVKIILDKLSNIIVAEGDVAARREKQLELAELGLLLPTQSGQLLPVSAAFVNDVHHHVDDWNSSINDAEIVHNSSLNFKTAVRIQFRF